MKAFLFFSIIIIFAIRVYGIDSRPNVVFLADDLGSKDLSCYDGPVKDLNRFSRQKGSSVHAFHAGAAVCSPQGNFLTGRQHLRTGVYGVLRDATIMHTLERK